MSERQYEILNMDAVSMAAQIAGGNLSSLEAVNVYIDHIKRIDTLIHCMAEDRFAAARLEAEETDLKLARGESGGRLFGVPITIKESFDIAGMKTTSGLPWRRNMIMEKDAEVVSRLKKEGAIFLGKTNTSVLCFYQETDNKLYGRSNNPWNFKRTVGGSSGGEGALIASGGAAVGIGSDIGGSIRFPSHFNGVVGFKSGHHQVSQVGSYPFVVHPLQDRMLGIGAIAKSVRDAKLINEIIARPAPVLLSLKGFSVTLPFDNLLYPVEQATKKCLLEARNYLKMQMEVVDEPPPYYTDSALLWQLVMSMDAEDVAALAFGNRPVKLKSEYIKELFFKSSELHRYIIWVLIGAILFAPAADKKAEVEDIIKTGEMTVSEYLSKRLLILPVYHTAAPRHGQVMKELFSIRRTFLRYIPFVAYSNTWGLPALTIPVSENEDGLPIGIQVISRVGNEEAIFELGEILEKHFRGYRRAPIGTAGYPGE